MGLWPWALVKKANVKYPIHGIPGKKKLFTFRRLLLILNNSIMKKKNPFISSALILFAWIVLPVFSKAQSCDPIDALKLKDMLIQMGYTVKDIGTEVGKEKYQVDIKTSSFNVPLGYEISPSKNYIWLTANLGKPKDSTSTVNADMLKQNGKIQPCQFYITSKGILMMGLAVENRGLTPAIMRRHTDKITADVSSTSTLWK